MKYILSSLLLLLSMIANAEVLKISDKDLLERIEAKDPALLVIDIRTPEEFESGHIPGAINIPHLNIIENISVLDPYLKNEVVLHCRSGARVGRTLGHIDATQFKKLYHLEGDIIGWKSNNRPLEQ